MKSKQQIKRQKRSNLIVDLSTQGHIVRKVVVHWVVFCAASLAISMLIQFCSNPFESWQSTALHGLKAFAPVFLTLLCLGPVFVHDFLKVSNRIFGPIPRIREVLRAVRAGDEVAPLKSRKNDAHADLVQDINAIIELIQSAKDGPEIEIDVEGDGSEAEELRRELAELRAAVHQASTSASSDENDEAEAARANGDGNHAATDGQ